MGRVDMKVLDAALVRYRTRLAEIRKGEIYKWRAVRHFQEAWDLSADDLSTMLVDAFQHNDKMNLIWNRAWFPIGMLSWFAGRDRDGTASAIEALLDGTTDLKSRMIEFEAWAKTALRELNDEQVASGNEPAKSHFQDSRSMSVYLAFAHPEEHYLYKATMYRKVAKRLGIDYPGNKFDKVIAYREMCEQILSRIMDEHGELVSESDALLGNLVAYDPSYHMLVQDVVYFMDWYDKEPDSQSTVHVDGQWYPRLEEYDPGIDLEQWGELIGDSGVFTESALEMTHRMRALGGQATCTQLSEAYGGTKEFYNATMRELGRRVVKATGCKPLLSGDGKPRWWVVPCIGRKAGAGESGAYVWKLRNELSKALEVAYPAAESEGDSLGNLGEKTDGGASSMGQQPEAEQHAESHRCVPYSRDAFLDDMRGGWDLSRKSRATCVASWVRLGRKEVRPARHIHGRSQP